ncbi:VirK/YbjX family protein [Ornithobacterium rhinotracheale]|uniref:VirK/YbjX family protein n=1 Tax=Ornithobacterium rhinotracheale TaxID=28251 RepID=UPI001FF2889F|nr:DUF535 family protein [Ornithobacterium rhinotracheale]MCK0204826.1 VirK/YbjX family protein [Ornithobacterium rhinotracheale]
MEIIRIIESALRMTDEAYREEGMGYNRKQKMKIVALCLLSPNFARRWFDQLLCTDLQEILKQRKRLFFKPFRVYMSTKWSQSQRMKAILDTYYFSNQNAFLGRVLKTDGFIKIADVCTKERMLYLNIGYNDRFRKEGEYVLNLIDAETAIRIYSLSFCFLNDAEGISCMIGCVQGGIDCSESFLKIVQKAMHGLRPKSFMVYAIQELAKELGCVQVKGVGNKIQSHNKKHLIHIDFLHKLSFDYNKFWEEAGGGEKEDWYLLPIDYLRKPIEEIKSKKRSQYKRRYEMLDIVAGNIQQEVQRGRS